MNESRVRLATLLVFTFMVFVVAFVHNLVLLMIGLVLGFIALLVLFVGWYL